MLDDFRFDQAIAYKVFFNSLKRQTISHAYLIETNGYYKAFDFALSFAKSLLCPYNYTCFENCNKCRQCTIIDDNNFLELKIIKPDGEWIKKEQLEELQTLFSKKAVIGNKKVYIIDGIEKLNTSSANSILKFLEEPEEGIIAILLTDNINAVLSTIISRCQLISLKRVKNNLSNSSMISLIAHNIFNNEFTINQFIESENSLDIINNVINFVNLYEEKKLDTLLEIETMWNSFFKERKEISLAFEIMLLYYNDILDYKLGENIQFFSDYKKYIQNICIHNSLLVLTKKINIIIDLKNKIKYNININLLMDKLLISFKGCEDDEKFNRNKNK